MATALPRPLLEIKYYSAAQEYLRSLRMENFMEAVPQGQQREITMESFAVVRVERLDLHLYNELLLQYRLPRGRIGQIVPDNSLMVWDGELDVDGSYDLPLQPVGPFWVFEYVSKHNKRKDYEISFSKYERDLKVPYYLVFYPDNQEMTLFHRKRGKYVSVKPNGNGRCAVPELDMEVALLDGWVRFWHKGKLLPLPAELQRALDKVKLERDQALQERDAAREEVALLRAQIEQLAKRAKNGNR